MKKPKILFLCGANSCRSQMAEGWARHLGGFFWDVYSAGARATSVRPNAARAMKERGVDIGSQWSKTVDKVPARELDHIVTLCAEGAEVCPAVPGPAQRRHWPVADPAAATGSDEDVMAAFRKARDEIEGRVRAFLAEIQGERVKKVENG